MAHCFEFASTKIWGQECWLTSVSREARRFALFVTFNTRTDVSEISVTPSLLAIWESHAFQQGSLFVKVMDCCHLQNFVKSRNIGDGLEYQEI